MIQRHFKRKIVSNSFEYSRARSSRRQRRDTKRQKQSQITELGTETVPPLACPKGGSGGGDDDGGGGGSRLVCR